MQQAGEEMGKMFSTTPVPAALRRELSAAGAGVDPEAACNVPLQLGCGVKGGAEIAVAIARALLQKEPTYAICSEDKVNGFNAVRRRAIYEGLLEWFPALIPTFRAFYARPGALFTVGPEQHPPGILTHIFSMPASGVSFTW